MDLKLHVGEGAKEMLCEDQNSDPQHLDKRQVGMVAILSSQQGAWGDGCVCGGGDRDALAR